MKRNMYVHWFVWYLFAVGKICILNRYNAITYKWYMIIFCFCMCRVVWCYIIDYDSFNVYSNESIMFTIMPTDTQIRHTCPLHGLYCRNGKPNISLDCESFEGSTNRAFVSEQTLLELNLFLLCSEWLPCFQRVDKNSALSSLYILSEFNQAALLAGLLHIKRNSEAWK